MAHQQLTQSMTESFDWMNGHPKLMEPAMKEPFSEVVLDLDLREHVPIAVQQMVYNMISHLPFVFEHIKQTRPFTIVHADARVENMMFPREYSAGEMNYKVKGEMEIDESYDSVGWLSLDWQTITKSMGVYDLAYFASLDMCCDSDSDDKPDRILCDYYHSHLVKNGIRGYSKEECWFDYRISVLIASLIPFAIMSTKSLGPGHAERAKQTRIKMLKRSVACILRVKAWEAMAELLEFTAVKQTPKRTLKTIIIPHSSNERETVREEDDAFSHHSPSSLEKLEPGPAAEPGTGRRDAYDRWFLNGYSKDGSVFFACACGFYPGRTCVDAAFSVCINGIQKNLRVSRFSKEDDFNSQDTSVGAIRLRVEKSLVSGVLEVRDERLSCVLNFTAKFPAVMEPPFQVKLHKMQFDYKRMTQLVVWDGVIETDKKQYKVDQFMGTRDRSFGTRPHTSADRSERGNEFASKLLRSSIGQKLASLSKVQFYWLWVPLHFLANGGLAMHSQETSSGHQSNSAVKLFSSADGPIGGELKQAEAWFEYKPGTRHIDHGEITLELASGVNVLVQVKSKYPFFMNGLGYNSIKGAHGSKPQAPSKTLYEELCTVHVDRKDPSNVHIQEICDLVVKRRGTSPSDEYVQIDSGIGVVEQMIVGPHEPSGFRSFADA